MAPSDLTYRTALYRVRISASSLHATKGRKLLQAGDEQGALMEFLRAVEIDPGNEAAQQEIAKLRERQGQKPPEPENGIARNGRRAGRNRLHGRAGRAEAHLQ